ncbi:MAG: hypothetical protein QM692_19345 [Thermomicrobiales bacterium]
MMADPESNTHGVVPQPDDGTGGDAACWAHLLTDDAAGGALPARAIVTADLAALAAAARTAVPWSTQSADLSVNLLSFAAGDGVAPHVNSEVDVLLVGVAGEGVVSVDDATIPLAPGGLILIPAGSRREIRAQSLRFAYLSCHRTRSGLLTLQALSREGHDAG